MRGTELSPSWRFQTQHVDRAIEIGADDVAAVGNEGNMADGNRQAPVMNFLRCRGFPNQNARAPNAPRGTFSWRRQRGLALMADEHEVKDVR